MIDLTQPAALQYFQTTSAALIRDGYEESHRLAETLRKLDLAGILVPAAIGTVARTFPHIQLVRNRIRVVYVTPHTGMNLVQFPHRYQEFHELERYRAIVRGLTR